MRYTSLGAAPDREKSDDDSRFGEIVIEQRGQVSMTMHDPQHLNAGFGDPKKHHIRSHNKRPKVSAQFRSLAGQVGPMSEFRASLLNPIQYSICRADAEWSDVQPDFE